MTSTLGTSIRGPLALALSLWHIHLEHLVSERTSHSIIRLAAGRSPSGGTATALH